MVFSQRQFEEVMGETRAIFKNREVFTMDYLPEIYKYRDQQLKKMVAFSKNIKEGLAPHHMILTGSFATGKTSATKKFFQLLEENFNDTVQCVHINCQFDKTEHNVLSEIYSKISSAKKSYDKHSSSKVFDKIMEELMLQDKILIIALDDYNLIQTNEELNSLLYKLLRAHEKYDNIKISVFLISNNEEFFAFNPTISTVFDPISIYFDPYTHSQTYDILKQRCQAGFIKGAINKEVLMKVTDYTRDQGDLRDGIHMLAHAGEKAEIHGYNEIRTDCLF